jgi:pyruvate/2-oxoglutarate dehydrogenase complex dihydrolipoamide acyltransferase (E2) component
VKINLKLARMGMNMEEATLVKWHKQPGERFKTGDILYEIETEKTTQEIAATGDGTMLELRVPEGETVEVGAVLCVVEADAAG